MQFSARGPSDGRQDDAGYLSAPGVPLAGRESGRASGRPSERAIRGDSRRRADGWIDRLEPFVAAELRLPARDRENALRLARTRALSTANEEVALQAPIRWRLNTQRPGGALTPPARQQEDVPDASQS